MAVTLKNFKLIYLFLTVPICKDQATIGKILQILCEAMTVRKMEQAGDCEKLTSDVQFKRLALLSKIIIACNRAEPERFERYETNPKRLKMKPKTSQGLPSKFQREDKSRILECLTDPMRALIFESIMKALNDCMLIQTLPKHSLKQIKTPSLKVI